ncbi:monofunctional biosynthetic peptidoglycan transglycosylase [Methylosarcina fibrata]|uniref:monofunctional biosynthetic peptidoglycan transglycosylase n=1 Tax=Methylosarcina fibrata TaxID=105972 RepID=UPI0012FCA9FF
MESRKILSPMITFVSARKKRSRKAGSRRKFPSKLGARLRNGIYYGFLAFAFSSIMICALLRWTPPPSSAFMLFRHVEDMVKNRIWRPIDYQWVSSEQISPNAYRAVIASEDQRFFQHSGFDLQSIQSSIDIYIDGGRLRGASTISQQVAKNLFLNPSKSILRKGFEVWFTLLIELLWSKERILTVYLNIAEFGDHVFGIQAASRHYFGIPANNLSRPQAALLAASLPNPLRLKVARPSGYLIERQHWILRQMRNIAYPLR